MKSLYRIFPVFLVPVLFTTGFQDAFPDSVQFEPAELDFRSVQIDNNCKPNLMCAINIGSTTIENPKFQIEGSNAFRIQPNFGNCPDPLLPGEVCEVYIDFCPDRLKSFEAILTFSGSSQEVFLKGRGKPGSN